MPLTSVLRSTRVKNPCYKCEDRTIGCHAGCESYSAWKAEQVETREKISAAKARENIAVDYVVKGKLKAKKIWKDKTK